MMKNILVSSAEEYAAASRLFKEYAEWLGIDLSFQHFEEELQNLKSMYSNPNGGIILCKYGLEYAGCIAIRKKEEEVAELKRMFVRTAFQGRGIGKALLTDAIQHATDLRYKKIRLDTLNNMIPAISLYKQFGFYEIPAYYFNPEPTAVYFEKQLYF